MTTLPRGRCSVCRRDVALRKGGQVREHSSTAAGQMVNDGPCIGSGRPAWTSSVDTAARAAAGKSRHCAPAGSLELPEGYWHWPKPGQCAGQLRTAYVRKSIGGERGTYSNGYRTVPGKPAWIAVGVVCDGCGAFWPKSAEE